MTDSTEAELVAPARVAFDTSVLIDWHKRPAAKQAELNALAMIFKAKAANGHPWHFIYLDAARREFGGLLLDQLARETAEIAEILPCFDETVSLSRVPMILPVAIVGAQHQQTVEAFRTMAISQADSVVLADAVYADARYLVTTDGRMLRNEYALRQVQTTYDLHVVLPTKFLEASLRLFAPAAVRGRAVAARGRLCASHLVLRPAESMQDRGHADNGQLRARPPDRETPSGSSAFSVRYRGFVLLP